MQWTAEDADGKWITGGWCGQWPLAPEAGAALTTQEHAQYGKTYGGPISDMEQHTYGMACHVYGVLMQMVPDGGEVPWEKVPEHIKLISRFEVVPAKICVSF